MFGLGCNLVPRWRATLANESGSVAIVFALCLVVLMGTAGAAVDYGTAFSKKRTLRSALDSAVLAGVSAAGSAETLSTVVGGLTNAEKLKIAKSTFEANRSKLQIVDDSSFQFVGETLVGRAKTHVDTALLGVLGITVLEISEESKATSAPRREPLCFMAMHPTRKHTLELSDSVSVIAPDCHIYGNSNNYDDVVDPHTPQNFLVGKSIQAVGYGHHYLVNVTPPVEHAPELIPDPLANLAMPVGGACQHTRMAVSGGARTLNPGTYCGGLTINNGAVVTFNPGLYIVSGGKFIVSNAAISGDDVTISLADSVSVISWSASTIRLVAPKIGPYAGMVVMGIREPTTHAIVASTIDLHGVVYLVNGAFDWTNIGTPAVTSKWTAWIVDGISWQGDGTIRINFNLDASDIPYPRVLNVIPRPGSARLIN